MNGINPNTMNAMVNGTNGIPRAPENLEETKTKLNTFIYDYFLRTEQFELARALQKSHLAIRTSKTAPPRKLNSEENGEDIKDDFDAKKPADLPYPLEVPGGATDNGFLLDWFQIFWEMFFAPRKDSAGLKPSQATMTYMNQQKEQQTMNRQNGMPNNMMPAYQNMMRAGGPSAIGMVGRNMPQNPNMRQINPAAAQQQQQQQQQLMLQRQQQMMAQQQMAREGSDIDMTDPTMLAQNQFTNFQGQNTKKSLDAYSQNVAATIRGMPQNMQGQMMGNQGSMEEFYQASGNAMRGQMPANGQPQAGQGNHALQDYQMQLMLLEQQNKKRLLMARQEQDQVRPGEQPMGGQAGFAPNMSPQGSRSGPSPNPSEQMKRGTPKMGPAGLPGGPNSPMPDQHMMHAARGSPGAMNFNGMDMMQPGMKGVDGMPMPPGIRGPVSHPGYNGGPNATAQMEAAMRAQGRMPNGTGGWQQMGQGQGPGMQQGPQPNQQMGTPQQRNVNMPPPQNVPAQGNANGRPVSPAQSAAAGTPQPANKAAPAKKGKAGKDTKKQPQKKGQTAATPSADDNPPQTPTPATPITPMHPNSFKDGKGINGAQATSGQLNSNIPAAATQVAQSQQDVHMLGQFDTSMDIEPHPGLNMGFGSIDAGDVLEQFDFDAFLDTGENDINFDAMANYGNFDGLEAGAGDS